MDFGQVVEDRWEELVIVMAGGNVNWFANFEPFMPGSYK